MKKVLVEINVSLNWGSTGRIAEQIGICAENQGWDVYMVHGARYKNASHFKSIQVSTKIEEYFHWFYSTCFDAQGLGSIWATRRLVRKLKKIAPSVVHCHNIHGCYINYPILFNYLSECNIPVVWTFHDCWPFTGHCAYYIEANCEKWKTLCHSCPAIRSFPTSVFDNASRNYNRKKGLLTSVSNLTIVPVTNWLANEVKQSFLSNVPIHAIHNGIDLSTFYYRESDIRNRYHICSKYMLLSAATGFDERKGLEDYNKLSELLPDDYQIVLVGGLEKGCTVKLSKKILLLPKTKTQAELAEFYSSADVLLSLSFAETFGLTIVEAMACGTPVVAYDNTAQSEVVSEGTGFKVKTGNVEDVAKHVIEICENGKNPYREICRKHADEFFNKDNQCQKYVELFEYVVI